MAKQHTAQRDFNAPSSATPVDQRAWELYVKAVDPNATATRTPEHVVEQCFRLAECFESCAAARRTRRDGEAQ